MRILIADDDLTSRLVLVGVLKKWGHEVVAAEDGTEAILPSIPNFAMSIM